MSLQRSPKRFCHEDNGNGNVYPIDVAGENGQSRHADQLLALLNFRATLSKVVTHEGADFVIIATPTDYDPETNYFNAEPIEAATRDAMPINPWPIKVIKSTVPVDYTRRTSETPGCRNLIFPP
jgi:UDP-glucose 6-dehydrogenase